MMETPRQNWQLFSKAMSDDLVENIIKLGGETQKASTSVSYTHLTLPTSDLV